MKTAYFTNYSVNYAGTNAITEVSDSSVLNYSLGGR